MQWVAVNLVVFNGVKVGRGQQKDTNIKKNMSTCKFL